MKVLFTSAECAPFFKTGGLGDVIGALPKELVKKGTEVAVVLPYFTKLPQQYKEACQDLFHFTVNVGWREQYCGVKRLTMNKVDYYFIDNRYYFDREGLYGYFDDGERFAFFQMAAIELMEQIEFIPDIFHANDYHTAMIPFLIKEKYHWINAYQSIRTVLTIHNMEFQGRYNPEILLDLFGMGMERFYDGAVRFDNDVNFLKAGIQYADRVNTVSPSYAVEIQTTDFGHGLDGILRMEQNKLRGIVNGIDYEINNPETDELLFANFSKENLAGKKENKRELQKLLGLPVQEDVPLIAVVSRLTRQKGFPLVLQELDHMLQLDVQFALLGTGDSDLEDQFRNFDEGYPDKCAITIDFDLQLAQQLYAGADIFLMPSAFEPCGLSQMISMRYGTLPVVHEVGGLKDTVVPYNPIEKTGTGFGFANFSSFYLMDAVKKAVDLYNSDPETWFQLMKRAMTQDFSWETSSEKYLELYQEIV
ncbi:glycogen synthase GlgA [Gracilibacillus alcaliphilus]|uniref:glycogen synthase GlgA n=1 Tax=Gracilibacillus alcaliphilus TaxID=1401441 RepID=UPI00195E1AAD|nr:glycogen synthase GlgA [Gracilibacillus alcaliphilus]MBM7677623.1 starch synthase [Gracilibacillus alcaliphilus]